MGQSLVEGLRESLRAQGYQRPLVRPTQQYLHCPLSRIPQRWAEQRLHHYQFDRHRGPP